MAEELDVQTNFRALKTEDEVKEALDATFHRIFDILKSNPTLHALVDSREGDPVHKAGDFVTDYRDGTVKLKLSDGKQFVDITISALGGEISDTQHGLRGAEIGGSPMHPLATTTVPGFLSASDKVKLNGLTTSPSPSNATPASNPLGGAGASGSSADYSRADHIHPVTSNTSPSAIGTTAVGTSTQPARADHVHAHGNQAGGALHSAATTGAAGFMSAADKSKLNDFAGVFAQASQPSAVQVPAGSFGIWDDTIGNGWVVVNIGGAVEKIGPSA